MTGICGECGAVATFWYIASTGRVFIDRKDAGQDVWFCEKHRPQGDSWYPTNCKRVEIVFAGRDKSQ